MKVHFGLLDVENLSQANYDIQFKTVKNSSCMMCMCW